MKRQNPQHGQNADSFHPDLGNMFASKWEQIPVSSPDHKGRNPVELTSIRRETSELPGDQRTAPVSELP